MNKIITFINEKGGVGKTSACFNSAWELSNRGKKVLMIDMDGQRANLTFFVGIDRDNDFLTIADVFKKDTNIKETIINVKDNMDIIPATNDVANLDMSAKVSKYRKALSSIKDNYDYIFIDVNPTPGWAHYLSLSVSDYAIIVMLPDATSLEANKGIIETIEELQETTNPNLNILGILLNKYNERPVLAKQASNTADYFAAKLNTKVFASKIHQRIALSENVIEHKGITSYDPEGPAADEYRALVDEIEQGVQ